MIPCQQTILNSIWDPSIRRRSTIHQQNLLRNFMSQLYLFRPPSSTHLIFRTGTRQFPINQQELRCILREHDDTGWDGGWLVATIHVRTKTHDRKTRRIVNPPSLCIVARPGECLESSSSSQAEFLRVFIARPCHLRKSSAYILERGSTGLRREEIPQASITAAQLRRSIVSIF